MSASSLRSSSVRVKIHVPDRFPGAEAADDERLAIRVDHVDVVGVTRVEPDVTLVSLEQGTCGIKSRDAAEVFELISREASDVSAEAEPYHVRATVNVLSGSLVNSFNQ